MVSTPIPDSQSLADAGLGEVIGVVSVSCAGSLSQTTSTQIPPAQYSRTVPLAESPQIFFALPLPVFSFHMNYILLYLYSIFLFVSCSVSSLHSQPKKIWGLASLRRPLLLLPMHHLGGSFWRWSEKHVTATVYSLGFETDVTGLVLT